ncbi:helix-turn-helix domain-containing protein [Chloroflexota bacterium]
MNIHGETIKQYRKSRGWTQELFARRLGVSLYTVQRWESLKTHPSPMAVEKIQNLLGINTNDDQFKLL